MHKEAVSGAVVVSEFSAAGVERRLRRRLEAVVVAASRSPGHSFPKMMGDDASMDGCYRLLSNERVEAEVLGEPHRRQTSLRVQQARECIVAHDTSAIAFEGDGEREGMGPLGGSSQRGFYLHASLAIESATRGALGVLASTTWARADKVEPSKKRRGNETTNDPNRESLRWQRSIEACAQRVGDGRDRLVHVMDSEGDSFGLLRWLCAQNHRFVIRLAHDRCVLDEHAKHVREAMNARPSRFQLEVRLSGRKAKRAPDAKRRAPARIARTALLEARASSIRLLAPTYLRKQLGEHLTVNIVRVLETSAPAGEKPVDWVLYTTERIDTDADVQRVVELYRARWQVEDFFKALKTGCRIEKRQLESFHAMRNALMIFIPIAWQMLRLRAEARSQSQTPATDVLTATQIEVLNALSRRKLAPNATARDALLVVAALGGFLKHNGEPGWQTLAAGFEKLVTWEQAWTAAGKDVGNP